MDINILLSIIGIIVAVISVIVAYLQLKNQAIEKKEKPNQERNNLPEFFSLFAPLARIQGFTRVFTGRKTEIDLLKDSFGKGYSVILVEGVPGIGKTALVANLVCSRSTQIAGYEVGWIFCSERKLTLESLIRSIVGKNKFPRDECLELLSTEETDPITSIDCLIHYLSIHKILLVFDDIHLITETSIMEFIKIASRSKLRSILILTSEMHLDYIEVTPFTKTLELEGLKLQEVSSFLKAYQKDIRSEVQKMLWEKAGNGVPEAMRILVGLSINRPMIEVLEDIPQYSKGLDAWLNRIFQVLSIDEIGVIKFLAFATEPVPIKLFETLSPSREQLERDLLKLRDKFLITYSKKLFSLHPLIRNYALGIITDEEKCLYSNLMTEYYARQARDLLTGIAEEPSYGKAYLEAHPDYVGNYTLHEWFVDRLLLLLRENQCDLPKGSNILVLGAGHGTHDVGLAKYGLRILNVELL
jgi:hypothetical protein